MKSSGRHWKQPKTKTDGNFLALLVACENSNKSKCLVQGISLSPSAFCSSELYPLEIITCRCRSSFGSKSFLWSLEVFERPETAFGASISWADTYAAIHLSYSLLHKCLSLHSSHSLVLHLYSHIRAISCWHDGIGLKWINQKWHKYKTFWQCGGVSSFRALLYLWRFFFCCSFFTWKHFFFQNTQSVCKSQKIRNLTQEMVGGKK